MTDFNPNWIIFGAAGVVVLCTSLALWTWWRKPGPELPPRLLERLGIAEAVPVEPPPLLDLSGVSKSYRDAAGNVIPVLRNVTLTIRDGITAIIGPSGHGKSTLLNLLGGLDTPDSGVIRYRGVALPNREGAALRGYRGTKVGFVFQDLNLVTHQTAAENVALALLCRGADRAEALAKARENLRAVGLEERADRRPAQLSGGERQRVAITRAFTAEADLILADEPTGSLDPRNARRVMDLFSALARQKQRSVILVTHDEELAKAYSDRILRCTEDGIEDVTPRPALPQLSAATVPQRRSAGRGKPRIRFVPSDRPGEVYVRLVLRDQLPNGTNHKEDRS